MNTEELKQLEKLRFMAKEIQSNIENINKKKRRMVADWIKINKQIAELRKKVI